MMGFFYPSCSSRVPAECCFGKLNLEPPRDAPSSNGLSAKYKLRKLWMTAEQNDLTRHKQASKELANPASQCSASPTSPNALGNQSKLFDSVHFDGKSTNNYEPISSSHKVSKDFDFRCMLKSLPSKHAFRIGAFIAFILLMLLILILILFTIIFSSPSSRPPSLGVLKNSSHWSDDNEISQNDSSFILEEVFDVSVEQEPIHGSNTSARSSDSALVESARIAVDDGDEHSDTGRQLAGRRRDGSQNDLPLALPYNYFGPTKSFNSFNQRADGDNNDNSERDDDDGSELFERFSFDEPGEMGFDDDDSSGVIYKDLDVRRLSGNYPYIQSAAFPEIPEFGQSFQVPVIKPFFSDNNFRRSSATQHRSESPPQEENFPSQSINILNDDKQQQHEYHHKPHQLRKPDEINRISISLSSSSSPLPVQQQAVHQQQQQQKQFFPHPKLKIRKHLMRRRRRKQQQWPDTIAAIVDSDGDDSSKSIDHATAAAMTPVMSTSIFAVTPKTTTTLAYAVDDKVSTPPPYAEIIDRTGTLVVVDRRSDNNNKKKEQQHEQHDRRRHDSDKTITAPTPTTVNKQTVAHAFVRIATPHGIFVRSLCLPDFDILSTNNNQGRENKFGSGINLEQPLGFCASADELQSLCNISRRRQSLQYDAEQQPLSLRVQRDHSQQCSNISSRRSKRRRRQRREQQQNHFCCYTSTGYALFEQAALNENINSVEFIMPKLLEMNNDAVAMNNNNNFAAGGGSSMLFQLHSNLPAPKNMHAIENNYLPLLDASMPPPSSPHSTMTKNRDQSHQFLPLDSNRGKIFDILMPNVAENSHPSSSVTTSVEPWSTKKSPYDINNDQMVSIEAFPPVRQSKPTFVQQQKHKFRKRPPAHPSITVMLEETQKPSHQATTNFHDNEENNKFESFDDFANRLNVLSIPMSSPPQLSPSSVLQNVSHGRRRQQQFTDAANALGQHRAASATTTVRPVISTSAQAPPPPITLEVNLITREPEKTPIRTAAFSHIPLGSSSSSATSTSTPQPVKINLIKNEVKFITMGQPQPQLPPPVLVVAVAKPSRETTTIAFRNNELLFSTTEPTTTIHTTTNAASGHRTNDQLSQQFSGDVFSQFPQNTAEFQVNNAAATTTATTQKIPKFRPVLISPPANDGNHQILSKKKNFAKELNAETTIQLFPSHQNSPPPARPNFVPDVSEFTQQNHRRRLHEQQLNAISNTAFSQAFDGPAPERQPPTFHESSFTIKTTTKVDDNPSTEKQKNSFSNSATFILPIIPPTAMPSPRPFSPARSSSTQLQQQQHSHLLVPIFPTMPANTTQALEFQFMPQPNFTTTTIGAGAEGGGGGGSFVSTLGAILAGAHLSATQVPSLEIRTATISTTDHRLPSSTTSTGVPATTKAPSKLNENLQQFNNNIRIRNVPTVSRMKLLLPPFIPLTRFTKMRHQPITTTSHIPQSPPAQTPSSSSSPFFAGKSSFKNFAQNSMPYFKLSQQPNYSVSNTLPKKKTKRPTFSATETLPSRLQSSLLWDERRFQQLLHDIFLSTTLTPTVQLAMRNALLHTNGMMSNGADAAALRRQIMSYLRTDISADGLTVRCIFRAPDSPRQQYVVVSERSSCIDIVPR